MFGTDISPTLSDLVTDPIALLLMRRDGVEPADVIALMTTVKRSLNERRRHADAGRGGACCTTRRSQPHASPRRRAHEDDGEGWRGACG